MQHRQLKDDQGIREIHVDYCFMGQSKDDKAKCIVVAKDCETRVIMSSVVPAKGTSHEFPARRIREPIDGEKDREARNEEITELERRVYVTASLTECWEKTGKPPIRVRCVDVHK